jgi:MFS family permease
MISPIWIATALGLAGGVALAYALGSAVMPGVVAKADDALLFARLAFAGTVVAFLPAIILSLVVGGTLGGAWGEYVFGRLGFASSGAPFGLAVGVALVFAAVLLSGAAGAILLTKGLLRYRKWRARTTGRDDQPGQETR